MTAVIAKVVRLEVEKAEVVIVEIAVVVVAVADAAVVVAAASVLRVQSVDVPPLEVLSIFWPFRIAVSVPLQWQPDLAAHQAEDLNPQTKDSNSRQTR